MWAVRFGSVRLFFPVAIIVDELDTKLSLCYRTALDSVAFNINDRKGVSFTQACE